MQLTKFVRPLGFLLALGLAGFTFGCGSGVKEGGAAATGIGKEIRKEQGLFHKKLIEKQAAEHKSERADLKRGRHRGPSGP